MGALNLDVLENRAAAAEKVAPGCWSVEAPMDTDISIVMSGKPAHEWRFIAHCPLPDEDEHEAFTGLEAAVLAEHIAAFSPYTASRLIKLARLLTGASHALRSYQYGNSATDLAKGVADAIDAALAGKDATP